MITVFTPTYNRGYVLDRLYQSLEDQSCKDFEWVVVDDGSTDNTKDLLASYSQKASFPMRYEIQENTGKHAAINRGCTIAAGDWFFIVDSDDWLPNDSIETNLKYLEQIACDSTFAGVSGLRARADGSFLVAPDKTLEDCDEDTKALFAREYIDATSQDYRCVFKMPGDRAEIVRTNLVREFPFPIFPGEKFVSEYYLWQSISENGLKIRWFNKPTYCGDYLEDGLTLHWEELKRNNPRGRVCIENLKLKSHSPFKVRLRAAVEYVRYGKLAGVSLGSLLRDCGSKPLFFMGLPIAFVLPLDNQKG